MATAIEGNPLSCALPGEETGGKPDSRSCLNDAIDHWCGANQRVPKQLADLCGMQESQFSKARYGLPGGGSLFEFLDKLPRAIVVDYSRRLGRYGESAELIAVEALAHAAVQYLAVSRARTVSLERAS